MQIGSSILIDVGWSEPQMVTMDLVGGSDSGGTNQEQEEQQLNSDNVTTADFVLVSVIPNTALANNNTVNSSTTT